MKIDMKKMPVIYINLDRDTQKRQNMETLFSKHNFENVHRSPGVIVENEHVCVGIAHAFKNAFELAFSVCNDEPFLMVEDDLVERPSFKTEIDVPDNFDACYLGISTWARLNGTSGPYLQGNLVESRTDILKINNMLSGHAIVYNNGEYAKVVHEKMSKAIKDKTYQDIEFAETMGAYNVYAFTDPLFYQTSSHDVTNVTLQISTEAHRV
tara:strand:+ start:277 stop:906 length:630 start_codon:yes stop_codon:yes gene_type:complete